MIEGPRIHASPKPVERFWPPRGISPAHQVYGKPPGLWYGFRDEWLKWCMMEQFNDEKYSWFYSVDLSKVNMLFITSDDELGQFESRYGCDGWTMNRLLKNLPRESRIDDIDWNRVRRDYEGVEIVPYLWKCRLSHLWYYGWDVASGCVWGGDPDLMWMKPTHKLLRKYVRYKNTREKRPSREFAS